MSTVNIYRSLVSTPMTNRSPELAYFTSGKKKCGLKRNGIRNIYSSEPSIKKKKKLQKDYYYTVSPCTPLYERCRRVKKRLDFENSLNSSNKCNDSAHQTAIKIKNNLNISNLTHNEQIQDERAITPNLRKLIKNSLSLNHYKILKGGKFGSIILNNIYKGKETLVKLIYSKITSNESFLINEKNGLGLNHMNVANTSAIFCCKPNRKMHLSIMVMESFDSAKNLQKILDNKNFRIGIKRMLRYSLDIGKALQYLHSKNILHLDLKPKNILICSSDCCKLFNFGASMKIKEDEKPKIESYCLRDTFRYCAPELLLGETPTNASDVYSLGITMWQIVHRTLPYDNIDESSLIYQVATYGLRPAILHSLISSHAHLTYKNIYVSCWRQDQSSRYTIDQVLLLLNSLKYKLKRK